jgi:hypothetical protein
MPIHYQSALDIKRILISNRYQIKDQDSAYYLTMQIVEFAEDGKHTNNSS